MLFDPISKDDTDQLIDRTFYNCPDFVSTVPFISAAQRAGICPQGFFGIDINHPSARRGSVGI